jgi:hypothetical protein
MKCLLVQLRLSHPDPEQNAFHFVLGNDGACVRQQTPLLGRLDETRPSERHPEKIKPQRTMKRQLQPAGHLQFELSDWNMQLAGTMPIPRRR